MVAGGQEWTVHVGLRRFTHDRRGRLYLNGRHLLLRGTSFHEQAPGRGAALGPEDRDAIVARLRALGVNLARQHYPPHPALLEAFDRYGILFWEQVPAFKLRGSLLGAGPLQRRALGMLRDAVLRDRNHASVLTWSIANETDPPRAGEATYVRRAVALIRRYDTTRLIAADATARRWRDAVRLPAADRDRAERVPRLVRQRRGGAHLPHPARAARPLLPPGPGHHRVRGRGRPRAGPPARRERWPSSAATCCASCA